MRKETLIKAAERESGIIHINPNWDQLTKDSTEAMNAGVSYGKYIAEKWEKKKEKEAEIYGERKNREREADGAVCELHGEAG